MASNPFSQMLPILNGKNYQMWAIKMKAHFKALSLWEVVEREADPTPLVQNPTLAQIKKYEEDLAKKPKALTYIHAAVSEVIFTRIMAYESPKEAWDKLKEEFEGSERVKSVKLLGLKREFEMLRLKEGEKLKDYSSKLMEIVNQIRLLGEDFPDHRVVEKILVSLPDRFEPKISAIEESHDLKSLTIVELLGKLQAQEQRAIIRSERVNDETTLFVKQKGKYSPCSICEKTNHEEKECWHKGKPQCFQCKRFGHKAKDCRFKEETANVVQEEILL